MNKKIYGYIALLSALYLFQLTCKFNHFSTPQWFSAYFADLLCIPLLLLFTLLSIRKIKGLPHFYLSREMILFTFIYVSIIFEFILPSYSSKFTADKNDLLIYAVGSFIFYFIQKHSLNSKKVN